MEKISQSFGVLDGRILSSMIYDPKLGCLDETVPLYKRRKRKC